jgi:hypothetical protein
MQVLEESVYQIPTSYQPRYIPTYLARVNKINDWFRYRTLVVNLFKKLKNTHLSNHYWFFASSFMKTVGSLMFLKYM